MDVGFPIAVRIAEMPDAVAVEDVDLLVADRERERLVQARGETPPADPPGRLVETADEPDVAVERDAHARAVLQELDVARPHVPAPGVVERQRDVVDDVGVLRGRHGAARGDVLRPASRGNAGWNRPRRDGGRRAIGERGPEFDRRVVRRHAHGPHLSRIAGRLPRSGGRWARQSLQDGARPGCQRNRRLIGLEPQHEPQRIGRRSDVEMPLDRERAPVRRERHPLADACAAGRVLEDRTAGNQAHGDEAPHRLR